MNKYNFLIFLWLFLFSLSAYSNRPYVINLTTEEYRGDNKNWSIGQDERGVVYFGNDIGLLEFDGIEWTLNDMPNSLAVRSVAVLSHKTIFTGSYEEFGRWDRDISGKLIYTSLSEQLDNSYFHNDDFWKISIDEYGVYFQSFTSIYLYNYESVKEIPSDYGFLFLSKVRNEYLIQQMRGDLFRLEGNVLSKIGQSEMFRDTDVRVILPFSTDKYLIGTATKGIYIYDGDHFQEWSPGLSAQLNTYELNCGILSANGTYFFGTILNGIYQVDATGKIIDHISTDNTLQNNTVLALYEDNRRNIWVALDRGISFMKYVDNMSYYIASQGNMGAVYGAALWNDRLFIGTNQGVFYIPVNQLDRPDALSGIKLIEGTQGQVWSMKVIDGKLYCGHNRGLKEIHKDLSVTNAYGLNTGVYRLSEVKIKDRDLFFLSTYQSLKIIDPRTGMIYSPQGVSEPIINTEVDHLGNIWLEHFMKGVYRCQLTDDWSDFRNISYYGGNNDDLPYKMKIFKIGGRIVLLGDNKFYTYDDISDSIVMNSLLNECFQNTADLKDIVPLEDNLFWALGSKAIYKFFYDGYRADIVESYNVGINLSLVHSYENVSVLNDSTSLVCLDNGFILYTGSAASQEQYTNFPVIPSPYLESLQTMNAAARTVSKDVERPAEISYKFNTVSFNFSTRDLFSSYYSFQYMLQDVDQGWSAPQRLNKISYPRLPEGKYIFKVRTVDNLGNSSVPFSYEFRVLPPWYMTIWAYLLYIILFIASVYIVWMLVLRRHRKLYLQKLRNREAQRLEMLAEKLQQEIEQKNAEMFTQTSFIIQKNELILKIKDSIDEFFSKNRSSALLPLYQKINVLLNNNLDSEEDWKMFLIKFEEKHKDFFRKIKTQYPQLTNSDLRLCACLKLNLETKEIASLMNLSVRAVENSRYRLRKKLGLQPNQNLNDFFLNID